ncbi:VIT domain-containing protein [Hydrogenimonas sp.]
MNHKENLVLERVDYDIAIEGLVAKVRIEQRFFNPYETPIEAVFSFPVSGGATLLDVRVKIGERELRGEIVEKPEAQERYEEAIEDGDRAILLERNYEGGYTLNVGNLLPGEKAVVAIEYAETLMWRQNRVRWSLPTTFMPKYGDGGALGYDDVSEPEVSFMAENRCTLRMRVRGVLAESVVESPSVAMVAERLGDELFITLRNETMPMDKTIVVDFVSEAERAAKRFALVGRDFDGYAAIVSFHPDFGIDAPPEPKTVIFVVDCSGSMAGPSIAKAKSALAEALPLLSPEDTFNIVKFGSESVPLFRRAVPATEENIATALGFVEEMDADMGGTEMEAALERAYRLYRQGEGRKGFLFLVTDGAVYDQREVAARASESGMAHFVVGVGYAADEVFFKRVAEATGGSWESVAPEEALDRAIVNLFKKIDLPRAEEVALAWPAEPTAEAADTVLFDGDTFYASATFGEFPAGEAVLRYRLEGGVWREERVAIGESALVDGEIPSFMARMSADRLLRRMEAEGRKREAVEVALKYRLFGEETAYILVDRLEEGRKPAAMPRIHRVANMFPDLASAASYEMCIDSSSFPLGSAMFMSMPRKRRAAPLFGLTRRDVEKIEAYFLSHGRLPDKEVIAHIDPYAALSFVRDEDNEKYLAQVLLTWMDAEGVKEDFDESFVAYLETLAKPRFSLSEWAELLS